MTRARAGSTRDVEAVRIALAPGGPAVIRVALVTDTHGFVDPRIAAAAADHDVVVHAGDVGASAVLEALRPRSGVVVAVRGNNDTAQHWMEDDSGVLDALPEAALLELPGGTLAVVHGHRSGPPAARHARLRAAFPGARAVAYGHSHRQQIDRSARPWVLNPGASGRARTFGGPGYLSLRASESRWEVRARRLDPLPRNYAPGAR